LRTASRSDALTLLPLKEYQESEGVRTEKPMNKQWHAENRMPPKATLEQRIRWHKEHQKHCACREVPKSLISYIKPKK
jgi:hypothetical protein